MVDELTNSNSFYNLLHVIGVMVKGKWNMNKKVIIYDDENV